MLDYVSLPESILTGPFAGDDFGHALAELAEGSCARQPGRFDGTRATLPTAQGAFSGSKTWWHDDDMEAAKIYHI